ncbi:MULTISPECIES: DUF760 domain-containing protein [unclassified Synechocystis]|uniref:DUF760 domain-containing protein n=1 Tax=unclassified Synechocystis TaxID=2640012 RepID=UPI0003F5FFE5|nr:MULTISPECIES: DUF760 domain-containing protein [unclassified Synechocystis]AIE73232.1 hypothetical protein D082_07030 [Synechocystis sp. PCC 6714]MCT0253064.1 DUF760 domain-containing protein [Synechocystis sp. CS-94]
MTHEPQRPQPLFAGNEAPGKDSLWTYVQELSPETIAQLSRPDSQEVFQVMERNIIGLLGNLPSEHFGVTISTSRENLGRLLASAMMSGYFLRNAEQRLGFEQAFKSAGNSNDGGNPFS